LESHDLSKRASWLWRGFTSLFPLSFFGLVSFLCCIFFHLLVLVYLFCLHFTWRGTLLKHALAEGAETERMIPDTTSDIYLLFIMFIFRDPRVESIGLVTCGSLPHLDFFFWSLLGWFGIWISFILFLLGGVTDTYTYIHFILPWHVISYHIDTYDTIPVVKVFLIILLLRFWFILRLDGETFVLLSLVTNVVVVILGGKLG